jgi:hypothetical protein
MNYKIINNYQIIELDSFNHYQFSKVDGGTLLTEYDDYCEKMGNTEVMEKIDEFLIKDGMRVLFVTGMNDKDFPIKKLDTDMFCGDDFIKYLVRDKES